MYCVSIALLPCTASPPDAVHVVLSAVREKACEREREKKQIRREREREKRNKETMQESKRERENTHTHTRTATVRCTGIQFVCVLTSADVSCERRNKSLHNSSTF